MTYLQPVPLHASAAPKQLAAFAGRGRLAPVKLSGEHAALCNVGVGDAMPELEVLDLGGNKAKLAEYYGERATVVFFWQSDLLMARWQLADLARDVAAPYGDFGVQVVGVQVNEAAAAAQEQISRAAATFPNLRDPDGTSFSKLGSGKLPRTYLLGPKGEILWFDIEYSRSTRRELMQGIWYVLGKASAEKSGG